MSKIGYYPGKDIRNNVTNFLDNHAKTHPEHVAFYWLDNTSSADKKHTSITIDGFVKQASHVASGLMKVGIQSGDRVVLLMPMSAQLYVAISALQRVGATPVFIETWSPASTGFSSSLEQIKPKGIVYPGEAFDTLHDSPFFENIPIKITTGKAAEEDRYTFEALANTPSFAPIVAVNREHPALITFTTGSSGTPKGANRTHRFLAAQHYALSQYISYSESDIDIPTFPVFALNNIACGVSTVIPSIDLRSPADDDAQNLIYQIESIHATSTTLSPSLFTRVAAYARDNNIRIPSLRHVITGGAPISAQDIEDFKKVCDARITILYGSTEVEPMAYTDGDEMLRISSSDQAAGALVGYLDDNLEYKIIKINRDSIQINKQEDWSALESTVDSTGELIVSGEHVCNDYYQNPAAFNKAKIRDTDGTIWHRTGDVVHQDGEKRLWILGRIHNTIVRQGIYLFTVEPETLIKQLPFVEKVAYIGLPDPELGEKAVVAVQLRKVAMQDDTAYEETVSSKLYEHAIPVDEVIFRESIPTDPRHHSKIEYDLLRQKLVENNKP